MNEVKIFQPTTYKILCIKNKFYHNRIECVRCNYEEEFNKELEYWKNKKCKSVVVEINKDIPVGMYRSFFQYDNLYD